MGSAFRATVAAFALVLAACGGGGGGGSGGGESAKAPTISFTPSSLQSKFLTGRSVSLSIFATPSSQVDQNVYVTIRDPAQVLAPVFSIQPYDASSYRVGLATSSSLQPGHYTGVLSIDVCFNPSCSRPFANSPLSVPYDFTVDPFPPAFETTGGVTGTYALGFPYVARLHYSNAKSSHIVITDTAGVFEREVGVPISSGSPEPSAGPVFLIRPRSSLAPGRYTGTIELHACQSQSCSGFVPETLPVKVPFDITIVPLPALTQQAGVEDWRMFQGDASHRGYSNITIDVSKIVPRWSWKYPNSPSFQLYPIVTETGRVLASTNEGFLYAMNEHDGSVSWSREFPEGQLNHPSVADGRTYVINTVTSATKLWALSTSDGSELFSSSISNQHSSFFGPTIRDGVLYTDSGGYGGIHGFNAATGQQLFFTPLEQYDMWTPAVDDQYVYAPMGGSIVNVVDRYTGTVDAKISYPTRGGGRSTVAILGGPGSLLTVSPGGSSNELRRVDVPARSEAWAVLGAYSGAAAYADQVIYAVNDSPLRLEARAEADGALLWSWAPPQQSVSFFNTVFQGDVLVTKNLVFVSTNFGTYAIDKETHQAVWIYPKRARVVISSNGTLLLTGLGTGDIDGDIVAFDTR